SSWSTIFFRSGGIAAMARSRVTSFWTMISNAIASVPSRCSATLVPHALLVPPLLLLNPRLLQLVQAVLQLTQLNPPGNLHAVALHVIKARVKIFVAVQHHGISPRIRGFELEVLLLFVPEGIETQMQGQHLSGHLLSHGYLLPLRDCSCRCRSWSA